MGEILLRQGYGGQAAHGPGKRRDQASEFLGLMEVKGVSGDLLLIGYCCGRDGHGPGEFK